MNVPPQPDPVGVHFADAIFIGTALYVLVLGVVAIVVGLRAGQRWIAFWGVTMVLMGGAYIGAAVLGYD